MKKKRHDHTRSMWILSFGDHHVFWCYQCGAWRHELKPGKWHKPSGIGGKNPAAK